MDYELVPIDDEVIHEHQDTADTYLQAGIIHQPINASLAFDRSLFTIK
jgi:hypothetical protein